MNKKIAVLIIDDSATNRKFLTSIINSSVKLETVSTAINGVFGLKKLIKQDIDVIILDLEMPIMDGIKFLEEKKKLSTSVPVIVFSARTDRVNEALTKGAVDFIVKSKNLEQYDQIRQEIIDKVLHYGLNYRKIKVNNHKQGTEQLKEIEKLSETTINSLLAHMKKSIINYPSQDFNIYNLLSKAKLLELRTRKFDLIAIGVSTGGPIALRTILPAIKRDFPVPIVIVQHMPQGFTLEFAKGLDSICNLFVKEAEDQDLIKKGSIYIGPGGKHMQIKRINEHYKIKLVDGLSINGHKPSVGMFFESVANEVRSKAIALILTGMGSDGSREIGQIQASGGVTIAQDEGSSLVFGMPKVAIEENNIDYVISLNNMVKLLNAILLN